MERYDVVVIGGGHAGSEAATAAARTGARTLLLTQNLETIGQMSCNPAIGGIGKGTVVREVDALGGVMGRATDAAMIQFRMLNRSKGPAVWSPRAQCDRGLYRRAVRRLLEQQRHLDLAQGTVTGLTVTGGRVRGVRTREGRRFECAAVVVTAGTFLRGAIHLGKDPQVSAGRAGDPAVGELSEVFESLGVTVERFKTGTPPRIDGRSVRLEAFPRQDGDPDPYWFSHFVRTPRVEQRPCYLAWAGPEVRAVVERNLGESALYGGAISGRGPRYCPSIEDKIVKFRDAERHQLFLEPEGLDTSEIYVNGLSTSLPFEVQLEMLRSVPGMEQVRMTRAGYAIEYDYFPPTQLEPTLVSRAIGGLYFAGQVNGTTGYEEAAGQGLVAGLNAGLEVAGREPVVLRRDEGMIGVLVDDLVTRGVDEPYRLFTSRAEYRLLLRQDNALRRLLPLAERVGILSDDERKAAHAQIELENSVRSYSERTRLSAQTARMCLDAAGVPAEIAGSLTIAELARRPGVSLHALLEAAGWSGTRAAAAWAEVELKYEGYLLRERDAAERLSAMEEFAIPEHLGFDGLRSLSMEAREKLASVRPGTLGRAARIPGITPADLQNLVLEVVKWRRNRDYCVSA